MGENSPSIPVIVEPGNAFAVSSDKKGHERKPSDASLGRRRARLKGSRGSPSASSYSISSQQSPDPLEALKSDDDSEDDEISDRDEFFDAADSFDSGHEFIDANSKLLRWSSVEMLDSPAGDDITGLKPARSIKIILILRQEKSRRKRGRMLVLTFWVLVEQSTWDRRGSHVP